MQNYTHTWACRITHTYACKITHTWACKIRLHIHADTWITYMSIEDRVSEVRYRIGEFVVRL